MPTVSESITLFLTARMKGHPGADLVERYLAAGGPLAMETQVNVAAGDGEPVAGKRSTYTDGINEWWNCRIPRGANADPNFKDYSLSWPLDDHAEGIGSTGWDWRARQSRWVAFDFDSITGHAAGVGISDEQLAAIRQKAEDLPYVEVRNSTGGKGIHLYVLFEDGIPTKTHTEHAALARCVLGMMSSETKFDFASQIDCCGGVMWLWHRKIAASDCGLKLVKPASKRLSMEDLPANWQDHIAVVTRQRSKIRVRGLTDEMVDPFEALASSRKIIPLEEPHKQIIEELTRTGFSTVWISDYHLLQTHTVALKQLMDRKELGLAGFFDTNSGGNDPGNPNCFLFPLRQGGWKVYRFSQGIAEAATWEQDGEGWTTCYFNRPPNLNLAARAMGGIEDPEKGGFIFNNAQDAMKAADALGQELHIPKDMQDRPITLKPHKDGRLIVEIKHQKGDELAGWIEKKGKWIKVFDVQTDINKKEELGFCEYDAILRALVSPAGDSAGWYLKGTGRWDQQPLAHIKLFLQAMGHPGKEADQIMGAAIARRWSLVTLPFQPEYPGDRQWNLNAPQFRVQPADLEMDEAPYHPHWDKVLDHCGQDLTSAIRELPWAQQANLKTGADYLRTWIACMLREPFEPLPYLFFFGPENSGKSILHEAVRFLITGGIVSADRALMNANNFNGELANAILAVIEETDLSKSGASHSRIKEWVTGEVLWIRKMRTDAYSQPNSLHFIQCANSQSFCPVFPGDTRITVVYVPDLLPEQEIPKKVLKEKLMEEAPHFLRTLLDMELPPVQGRLRLPTVANNSKQRAEELNRNPLQQFIAENTVQVPGARLLFSEFYDKFVEWLPQDVRPEWTKLKVSRELPFSNPSGAGNANRCYIGNLSWEPIASPTDGKRLVSLDGKLRVEG